MRESPRAAICVMLSTWLVGGTASAQPKSVEVPLKIQRKTMKKMLAASAVCFLAACGGGGGESGGQPAPESKVRSEGFWNIPDGGAFLITPQGEAFGIEGSGTGYQAHLGSVTTSENNFTMTGVSFSDEPTISFSLAGTVTPNKEITGKVTANTNPPITDTTTLTYDRRYDSATTLSAIASRQFNINSKSLTDTGAATVSADGTIAGTDAGCGFSGKISYADSGRNFYRISLVFAASANCDAPGQSMQGVVMPADSRSYGVIVANANKTQGMAFALKAR